MTKKNKVRSNPACPVCLSNETALKYRIDRHGFDVFACALCNSQFRYPLPENADAFYNEGYYTGTAAFNYQDERKKEYYHHFVHRARLATIVRVLKGAVGPIENTSSSAPLGLKFLDVGCAFGAFARAAAQIGFEAYGLDVSDYAVREGNAGSSSLANAARLFVGDLSHLPHKQRHIFAPDSFDAITLIEVAEHLTLPHRDLTAAFSLLKPGGVLVIQTANFEAWQAIQARGAYHYYLPGHLVYYTATGLKRMLREIGFREFKEFFPTDFPLWAKWRKAWGDIRNFKDLTRYWRMSLYHLQSKLRWRGRPLTSSYVLYARK